MASDPNHEIDRSTVEARQATDRPKVIYVLIVGVAFVIVAFIIAWLLTTRR